MRHYIMGGGTHQVDNSGKHIPAAINIVELAIHVKLFCYFWIESPHTSASTPRQYELNTSPYTSKGT